VTGAASGIGLASTEAMVAAGSRVVAIDRAALKMLCNKHDEAVIPLVIDLLDPKDCTTLLPRVLAGGRDRHPFGQSSQHWDEHVLSRPAGSRRAYWLNSPPPIRQNRQEGVPSRETDQTFYC
jgi:NAD(P)-dependent dehydrogenase (short-subunit alcohol dehydrogenase family)